MADTYDVGTSNEETWTVADLDDIARNHGLLFHAKPPLWEPPVGINHESDLDLAYGTVTKVWREGRHLWGSYGEVSPELEGLLRGRYLRAPSVELYRCPTQGNFKIDQPPGLRGATLRRVIYLGARPPRVKGLAKPVWAAGEAARLYCARPGWTCAEATMSADSAEHMRAVAEAAGFGDAGPGSDFLDSLQPEQLNLLVAAVAGRALGVAPADATTDTTTDTGADTGADDMAQPSREQMIQDLVAAGQDQAALEQMDDAALAELWKQTQGGGMAAAPSTYGERNGGGRRPQVIQVDMRTFPQLVRAEASKLIAQAMAPSTSRRISEFCEQSVRDGYLTVADVEVDAQGKTIGLVRKRLERASAVPCPNVSSFGERAGKSELELQMAEIRGGRQVRSYGERLADGPGGVVGGGKEDVEAEVKDYMRRKHGKRA
jgi:hypothetical protein